MKNLFLSFLMMLSLNALGNDGYNHCSETLEVVAKRIKFTQQSTEQRLQGICRGSYDPSCVFEAEIYKRVIQNLKQIMQEMQQYCADKYGQQQQQQHNHQNQQHTPQYQQVPLQQGQIQNTGYNTLVLCDGPSIEHLKKYVDRDDCVQPDGTVYQQPQLGVCSYSSVYLKNGENFSIGQQTYYCL